MARRLRWWLLLCCPLAGTATNALVGPGALTPYGGPPRGGPSGWGFVGHWPEGFFIGGSSLPGMNGLYFRDSVDHRHTPHAAEHLYRNPYSGWSIAYVNARFEEYQPVGGLDSEWLLVDDAGRDRFGHRGREFIPGRGTAWQHVNRPQRVPRGGFKVGDRVRMSQSVAGFWQKGEGATVLGFQDDSEGKESPYLIRMDGRSNTFRTQAFRMSDETAAGEGAVAGPEVEEADLDELPWQVVAVMSRERMEYWRPMQDEHERTVRAALADAALPPLALPAAEEAAPQPAPAAAVALADGCTAEAYADALQALDAFAAAATEPWPRPAVLLQRARCLRRARNPLQAVAETEQILGGVPRYKDALLENALALLDAGRPADAVRTLEFLLRVDRKFPGLAKWLTKAHAQARRRGVGLVDGGVGLGAEVELVGDEPGYWAAGDRATVVALGTATHPVTVKMVRTGRLLLVRAWQIRPVAPVLPGTMCLAPPEEPSTPPWTDHYALLRVSLDARPEDVRRAYKLACRQQHPDAGGSAQLFQHIAKAYAVLADAAAREAYDLGADLPTADLPSLLEEVHRRYFPEVHGLRLFGDPLENKAEIVRQWRSQRP